MQHPKSLKDQKMFPEGRANQPGPACALHQDSVFGESFGRTELAKRVKTNQTGTFFGYDVWPTYCLIYLLGVHEGTGVFETFIVITFWCGLFWLQTSLITVHCCLPAGCHLMAFDPPKATA